MHEQQRDCVRTLALLVHIMDVESPMAFNLYVASEHGELVDLRFDLAPVKVVLPAGDKTLDIGERRAVIPASAI